MSATRTLVLLTGAGIFGLSFLLLFTLIGALFGVILMREGLSLMVGSRL